MNRWFTNCEPGFGRLHHTHLYSSSGDFHPPPQKKKKKHHPKNTHQTHQNDPCVFHLGWLHPRKLIWQWKTNNFEDISPIQHGDFPVSHVSFRGGVPTICVTMKFTRVSMRFYGVSHVSVFVPWANPPVSPPNFAHWRGCPRSPGHTKTLYEWSWLSGWCSTLTLLLICSSFNRENGHPLLMTAHHDQHQPVMFVGWYLCHFLKATFWGPRSCEVAIIWPDSMNWVDIFWWILFCFMFFGEYVFVWYFLPNCFWYLSQGTVFRSRFFFF